MLSEFSQQSTSIFFSLRLLFANPRRVQEAQQQFGVSAGVQISIQVSISQSCPVLACLGNLMSCFLYKFNCWGSEGSGTLIGVAYCSCVCVFLLSCLSVCLCVFSSMTDVERELCTLLPLYVLCLLNIAVISITHLPVCIKSYKQEKGPLWSCCWHHGGPFFQTGNFGKVPRVCASVFM